MVEIPKFPDFEKWGVHHNPNKRKTKKLVRPKQTTSVPVVKPAPPSAPEQQLLFKRIVRVCRPYLADYTVIVVGGLTVSAIGAIFWIFVYPLMVHNEEPKSSNPDKPSIENPEAWPPFIFRNSNE